jgi:hypothetical protein
MPLEQNKAALSLSLSLSLDVARAYPISESGAIQRVTTTMSEPAGSAISHYEVYPPYEGIPL